MIGVQAHTGNRQPLRPYQVDPLLPVPMVDKPRGGLWTSTWTGPETISDWARWCCQENFAGGCTHDVWLLHPDPEAKIFMIDSREALKHLYDTYPKPLFGANGEVILPGVNWFLVATIYDAVSLTVEAFWSNRFTDYHELGMGTYGWDCESTCWFRWRFAGYEHVGELTCKEEVYE